MYFLMRRKISMSCGVPVEAVISSPDARSIYEVPMILEKQGIADYIIKRMNLTPYTVKRNMKDWEAFLKKVLAEVDRYCMPTIRSTVEIKTASLGDDSILYGDLAMIKGLG